jgi:hypothetical protein
MSEEKSKEVNEHVILELQSHIYKMRDRWQQKVKEAKLARVHASEVAKDAECQESSADYDKAKLAAVCQFLNQQVDNDTDYLAEVGLTEADVPPMVCE